MSYKTKFKIGEFSRLMQVTVKALRHYEQKELLIPDEVDEWTGYRYYSIAQMHRLNSIRLFQRLGFTLEEIRDLFDDESHIPNVERYKIAGHPRTCYIDGIWNQADPEKWFSIIQIPIE